MLMVQRLWGTKHVNQILQILTRKTQAQISRAIADGTDRSMELLELNLSAQRSPS